MDLSARGSSCHDDANAEGITKMSISENIHSMEPSGLVLNSRITFCLKIFIEKCRNHKVTSSIPAKISGKKSSDYDPGDFSDKSSGEIFQGIFFCPAERALSKYFDFGII